jgi:hypothetical protein
MAVSTRKSRTSDPPNARTESTNDSVSDSDKENLAMERGSVFFDVHGPWIPKGLTASVPPCFCPGLTFEGSCKFKEHSRTQALKLRP